MKQKTMGRYWLKDHGKLSTVFTWRIVHAHSKKFFLNTYGLRPVLSSLNVCVCHWKTYKFKRNFILLKLCSRWTKSIGTWKRSYNFRARLSWLNLNKDDNSSRHLTEQLSLAHCIPILVGLQYTSLLIWISNYKVSQTMLKARKLTSWLTSESIASGRWLCLPSSILIRYSSGFGQLCSLVGTNLQLCKFTHGSESILIPFVMLQVRVIVLISSI